MKTKEWKATYKVEACIFKILTVELAFILFANNFDKNQRHSTRTLISRSRIHQTIQSQKLHYMPT